MLVRTAGLLGALVCSVCFSLTASAQPCKTDGDTSEAGLSTYVEEAVETIDAPPTNWEEVFTTPRGRVVSRAEELVYLQQAGRRMGEMVRRIAELGDGTVRRGFHAKTQWAGPIDLTLRNDIPQWARYGLFAHAGETLQGVARLSNGVGFIQSDDAGDVRGLAVDIGVEGGHQQFLTTTQSTPFARNGYQFLAFAEASLDALEDGSEDGNVSADQLTLLTHLNRHLRDTEPDTIGGKARARAETLRIKARLAGLGARGVFGKDKSLANLQFWSGAPLKIGPYAAKVTFIPKESNGDPLEIDRKEVQDYLAKEFAGRLQQGDVQYDVVLQFYQNQKDTPIEDATVEWDDEALAVPVGTLTFHQGAQQSEEAARLRFSPFHTLGDIHDVGPDGYPKDDRALYPLSNIMRIRGPVYDASGEARHGHLAH